MTSLTGMFRGRAVWVGGTTTCVSIKYCLLWCLYGLLLMSYCESQDREESLRQLGMDSGGWKGHRRGEITNYSVHFNLWGSTQQRCNLASVFLCLWNTGQRSCSQCGITDASPALPRAVANKTKQRASQTEGPLGCWKTLGDLLPFEIWEEKHLPCSFNSTVESWLDLRGQLWPGWMRTFTESQFLSTLMLKALLCPGKTDESKSVLLFRLSLSSTSFQ